MGIYLASHKQEALVKGDMSGVTLHLCFVHHLISTGMHYAAIAKNSPSMVSLHARHVQRFFEELANIQRGNDLDLKVQSMLFLITGFLFVGQPPLAELYVWKVCKMLDAAGMRFIPRYGHLPPYSDEFHEKSTVLSQLIWAENYLFLTCGGKKPIFTTRIEEEFRIELPVSS